MSKFEIYTDKKGETRFRFRAKNGEVVFSSEGYTAKASAKRAIASIKKNVPDAPVAEVEPPAKKSPEKASAASKVAVAGKSSNSGPSKSRASAKKA